MQTQMVYLHNVQRITGMREIERGDIEHLSYIYQTTEEVFMKVASQVLGRQALPEDGRDFTLIQQVSFPGKMLISYFGIILGMIRVDIHETGERGYRIVGEFYPEIKIFQ